MPGLVLNDRKEVTPEIILPLVEKYTGITKKQMDGKTRMRQICDARHIYFYMLYKYTKLTLHKIGQQCNRDHATALHAVKKIKGILEVDKNFQVIVKTIDSNIGRTVSDLKIDTAMRSRYWDRESI